MKKQEKVIVIRIHDELKTNFNKKAESNYMTLSGRIKYLMKMDVDGKLKVNSDV